MSNEGDRKSEAEKGHSDPDLSLGKLVPNAGRDVEFRPAWVYISYTTIIETKDSRVRKKETLGAEDV
jgi:hypothetical protein